MTKRRDASVAKLAGVPLTQLTIVPAFDIAMMGAGGLMGIRAGVSLMIGANDFFACQALTADKCASLTEQAGVLATVGKNVKTKVKVTLQKGAICTDAHPLKTATLTGRVTDSSGGVIASSQCGPLK